MPDPPQSDQPHELAVACQGVTKEFGSGGTLVEALRGIDLEIRAGELTILEGPSGCGKTTLLTIIGGLLPPTAGEVRVLGRSLAEFSQGEKVRFRRNNLGFIFQQHGLLPAFTAAENAAIPLVIAGLSRSRAVAKAKELLEQVDLADRADALPGTLSGGEQQRVAIARALVHEPTLVLCDEPTASLDAQRGQQTMELLRAAAMQPDRAVIVVTHDPRVLGFADRVATIEDGRISEVREVQQIEEAGTE